SPIRELYLNGNGGSNSTVPPGNVTLVGTPVIRVLPADSQGNILVDISQAYTPPSPLATFDRLYAILKAPDDTTSTSGKATIAPSGTSGGFVVAANSGQLNVAGALVPTSQGKLV